MTDDWATYEKLVMSKLDDYNTRLAELEIRHAQIASDLKIIRYTAGIIGSGIAIIVSSAMSFILQKLGG